MKLCMAEAARKAEAAMVTTLLYYEAMRGRGVGARRGFATVGGDTGGGGLID